QLDDRVRRLAAMLREGLDIGPGDRVAHLGYNSPELLELLFACGRLGAILVPLNWRLAAPEHGWILQDCGAKAILAETEFAAHLEGLREALPDLHMIAYGAAPNAGWLSYAALLDGAGADADTAAVAPDDPLKIVYTSGTTGRPKGSVLSHQALFYNAVNSIAAHDLTGADHVLTVLPMFHVGGMNIHTTPAIHAGATVTMHARFDPGETLAAIARDRPSIFLAVPAMILAMTAHPGWRDCDLSSLRMVGVGSSTVPEALLRAFMDRGIPTTQIYGLTESSPVAVCLPIADAARKMGSCGKPVLHCQARVVDDDGNDAGAEERGEIVLRGPNLSRQYWNNPEATAEAFRNGWFHTGDVGHLDDEGYFYVDDRKKDVVISGGENIYPAELENILADCPEIQEAVVVARPDARWGEIPLACVVRKPGSELTGAEVLALFEGRIARYKHPRAVLFMAELPRNAMGKVLKFELRESLAAGERNGDPA
ncbi:MAG: long-chain fatty acid--CoA ligase, partial [Alphaproteobacteria bacterium]|nr:long-chain fatty acid--CoA ligase [Alphaproteobacteria bacterium]